MDAIAPQEPTPPHRPADEPHAGTRAGEVPGVFAQNMDRRLIIIILAVELGSLLMVTVLLLATRSPAWTLIMVFALFLAPVVLILKSRLTVRMADDRLRYAFFPFWRGGIDYRDIERVEVVKVNSLGQFGGWGIKSKFGGKGLGLIARCGPAVRIERANQRPVYITMDNAEELAVAIMERAVGINPEAPMPPYTIIEKRKPWFLWLPVWFGAAIVWGIFIAQIIFGHAVGNNQASDAMVWILTLLIGVLFPLAFWMFRITIRVDQEHMTARLVPFPGKRWPLENIVEGRVIQRINPLLYGGYGVRWLPGLGWLYALRHGDGVELRFIDGKKVRIVCDAPEQLLEALGLGDGVDERAEAEPSA